MLGDFVRYVSTEIAWRIFGDPHSLRGDAPPSQTRHRVVSFEPIACYPRLASISPAIHNPNSPPRSRRNWRAPATDEIAQWVISDRRDPRRSKEPAEFSADRIGPHACVT